MLPLQIAPDIYDVGVQDWAVRDFHGYKTERGATYNSYLIMDEKITLIDTVKAPFAAYMRASKGQKGDCAKKLQQIQYEYGLTEFQIEAYAKGVRNYFRGQINSQITQRLAHRVYESLSKLLYGTATRMHYCRSEDFSSIEGKSNQTGIRFFGDTVFYKKMQFQAALVGFILIFQLTQLFKKMLLINLIWVFIS